VLPPSDRFWYYLPDLPFEIQNAAISFQMVLEHLVIREALWSPIISGAAGADAPSLCAFLVTLQEAGRGITPVILGAMPRPTSIITPMARIPLGERLGSWCHTKVVTIMQTVVGIY
jgi:hypothetical protein